MSSKQFGPQDCFDDIQAQESIRIYRNTINSTLRDIQYYQNTSIHTYMAVCIS